jgi:hypothetical protein
MDRFLIPLFTPASFQLPQSFFQLPDAFVELVDLAAQ